MATDTGALILSAEGKLLREAGDVFQSLLDAAGRLAAGDLDPAALPRNLSDFGFGDDEITHIMAAVMARGGPMTGATFADAYVLMKSGGRTSTAGVDLSSTTLHCYYNHGGEPLSNFYPCVPAVEIGGATFATVEHYYQYQKHVHSDSVLAEHIRTASVSEAHILGGAGASLRPDWEQVRDEVYYTGMLAKFSQHEALRGMLQATGEKTLVQVDSDQHWGMCVPDDTPGGLAYGNNAGGRAVQRVREALARA